MNQAPNTARDTAMTPAVGRLGGLEKCAAVLIGVGALLSLLALGTNADRFSFAYLWGFTFVWTLALGSLFLVALHHATHAVWSVVIRRVAEMLASLTPILALLLVPLALFVWADQTFAIFPWSNPQVVQGDHLLAGKTAYLNLPFFVVRGAVFVGVWILFARFFVGRSLGQDHGAAGAEATIQMRRWSAVFMPVFALTITFASFDWLMSLEPHWYSTIYGVYVFSGMTLTGLAAVTLAVVWLRAKRLLPDGVVTDEHLYSLGALLFTFTCFWAYIAFSQFMLIWYGNLPEETVYFVRRLKHGWLDLSVALVIVRFVLPFFLLLSRSAKMNARRLFGVSVLILCGQLLDLYWLIMPSAHPESPRLGWQELGPLVLFTGIVAWLVARFLARHPVVAVGDPLLDASRAFHL